MPRHAALAVSLLAVTLLACPPAPKKDYTVDEIAGLDSLKEIMRLHAKHADPLFAIRGRDSFTDEQFAAMVTAGEKITATAARAEAQFAPEYDEGFGAFAQKLGAQAKALRQAGLDQDATAANTALNQMKDVCAGCHRAY